MSHVSDSEARDQVFFFPFCRETLSQFVSPFVRLAWPVMPLWTMRSSACPNVPLVDAFDKHAHASKACHVAWPPLPLLNRLLYIHTKPCSHQSSPPAPLPLNSTPPVGKTGLAERDQLTAISDDDQAEVPQSQEAFQEELLQGQQHR
jgi:hypothetical protein